MRVKLEKLPTINEFIEGNDENEPWSGSTEEALEQYTKLLKDRIKYEYDQYQFFLEGYRIGSASISVVDATHNEFLKLLS